MLNVCKLSIALKVNIKEQEIVTINFTSTIQKTKLIQHLYPKNKKVHMPRVHQVFENTIYKL